MALLIYPALQISRKHQRAVNVAQLHFFPMPLRNPPATLTTQHIPLHVPSTELLGSQLREGKEFESQGSYHGRSAASPRPARARRLQLGGNGNHPRGLQPWLLLVFLLLCLPVNADPGDSSSLAHPPLPGRKSPNQASCPSPGEDSRSGYRITAGICLCTPLPHDIMSKASFQSQTYFHIQP